MTVNYVKDTDHIVIMPDFVDVISRPYIRGIMQGAVLSGFQAEDLLARAGLPEALLNNPNVTLSGEDFLRLLSVIQEQTQDLFLCFTREPCKISLVMQQIKARSQAKTLGELMRISTQFRESVRNDIHYEYLLDDQENEFVMTVRYELREGVDEHIFYWHRLILIYRFYCWAIGRRIKLTRVCFACPQPDYYTDYELLFNCAVLFDQPYNGISFNKRYLLNSVIRSEEEELDFVPKNTDWLVLPGYDRSLSRQVEDVLVRLYQDGIWSPTTTQVAKILSISPRRLRRELGKERENFLGIKARIRCNIAIKLLTTTDLPVTVISSQIGYAEPGVFTRAFISWTNTTPTAYRAALQAIK